MREVALGSGGAITDWQYILCDLAAVIVNQFRILHWQEYQVPMSGYAFDVVSPQKELRGGLDELI